MRKIRLFPYVLILLGSFLLGLVATLATSHAIARGAIPAGPEVRQTAPVRAPGAGEQKAKRRNTTEC